MAERSPTTITAYIAAQPAAARPVLRRVRSVLQKALPGATEGISYQIPIYQLDGRMVLYFAGFEHHYSLYPATAAVLRALGAEARERLHGRGTLRFALDEKIPTRLITRIAKIRAEEARALELAKKVSKRSTRRAPGSARKKRAPARPKRRAKA